MYRTLFTTLLVICLGACAGGGDSHISPSQQATLDTLYPMTPAGTPPGASDTARRAAAAMAGGINFGNMLEAPHESPGPGHWGLKVEEEFIDLFGAPPKKSQSVRLPVRWSNHASKDADATIDPVFMARVKYVVDRLLTNNVTVVLNMHHYRQLDGDPQDPGEFRVDPDVVQLRFLSMWRQIARQFAYAGPGLVFELYNEPHKNLDSQWNALASRALRVVRESDARNRDRVVMIGPANWNSPFALSSLELPPDANLVLTVHHYEPYAFTHQGASWASPQLPTGVDCCDARQLDTIRSGLDKAVTEAARLGYPVVVGEFGAYSMASDAARVTYLNAMRTEMAARNLPWIYWELASGFGLYDPQRQVWRQNLLDALLP